MPLPIAVFDPVPAYRRGLIAALADADLEAEAPDDFESWTLGGGRRAALITVGFPHGLDMLENLAKANSDLLVVVLLREPTLDAYRQVLKAGASGVAPWDAPPEAVVRVMRAAFEGQCMVPVHIAQALAAPAPVKPEISGVTAWEAKWLRTLASGATVADLAHESSYSEREMFRLLQRLYQRMGVRNRTEALVKAAQNGLLS